MKNVIEFERMLSLCELHSRTFLTLMNLPGIMSLVRSQQPRGGKFNRDQRSSCARNSNMAMWATAATTAYYWNYDIHDYSTKFGLHNNDDYLNFTQSHRPGGLRYDCRGADNEPSSKRRKTSTLSFGSTGIPYQQQDTYQKKDLVNRADLCKPSKYNNAQFVCNNSVAVAVAETSSGGANVCALSTSKRDQSKFEDDEVIFMSRDEIENCSPSRKDGIDQIHETYLRYSYCSFLQNVGARLHL